VNLKQELNRKIDSLSNAAVEMLSALIAFPSVQGEEKGAQDFILSSFRGSGLSAEGVAIEEAIGLDPEYTFCDQPVSYRDRCNVVIARKGGASGRSLILNAHSDVVPAQEWSDAFRPKVTGGRVVGRGACDDKGQIAVLYLVLNALQSLGVELRGDLLSEIVIEEEVGGNGSLALIRQGYRAEGVVVLEPTELKIHPANRGVLWFRVTAEGKPVHMGRIYDGISAIDMSIELIRALRVYERTLIEDSRSHPLFSMHRQPVQLNIGTMRAGDWPATVPARAVFEGGVGFLPNKRLSDIKGDLAEIVGRQEEWLRTHTRLEFPKLHNDAFETPIDDPLVAAVQAACAAEGLSKELTGWIVSCDARLFSKVGGMPTVVFGAGSLVHAHANDEQVEIRDVLRAAKVLSALVVDWCGAA
jgi:acetylornithine deacetylase